MSEKSAMMFRTSDTDTPPGVPSMASAPTPGQNLDIMGAPLSDPATLPVRSAHQGGTFFPRQIASCGRLGFPRGLGQQPICWSPSGYGTSRCTATTRSIDRLPGELS